MKLSFLAVAAASLLFLSACTEDGITTTPSPVQLRAHTTAFAYVSSNTASTLGAYPIGAALNNPGSVTGPDSRMIGLPYADADGIVYDEHRNALYHVDRSDNRLVALADIDMVQDGEMLVPSAQGPSTFTQGREATFYNNKVVVADDVTPGRLVSYHVNEDNISEYRWQDVGIELWGIQMSGKDLWAIVDASHRLAMFEDYFKAKSGELSPTATVGIEGLSRTHGLNYDSESDVMVLTDIADAGSGTDGGLIIIDDFSTKWWEAVNGSGMIAIADQVRIYGPMSQLGNPVDVAVNCDAGIICVAERKQDGGKFLIFEIPSISGDHAPIVSTLFPGASAVVLAF